MISTKVILCMKSGSLLNKINEILINEKFTVVDFAKDGQECIQKCIALIPDILIIDFNINIINGIEVAKILLKNVDTEIVLLIPEDKIGEVGDLTDNYKFTVLVKPINKLILINTTNIIVKYRNRMRLLNNEIKKLKGILLARKQIEKAKGLLMENLGITEKDAYKKIQKQSMDKGLPMIDVAKAIIIAYDI